MIKPSLRSTRGERRPSRRRRVRAHRQSGAHAPQSSTHAAETRSPHCDPDVQQVRAAGGPIDRAAYACACGYLFSAAVSTTVNCPHCGCGQAW